MAKKYETEFQKSKTYMVGGSWFKRVKMLKRAKKDFSVTKTTTTVIVTEKGDDKIGTRRYMYIDMSKKKTTPSGLKVTDTSVIVKPEEIRLRNEIKKHVLKNVENIDLPIINQRDILYTRTADWLRTVKKGEDLGECISFDINMAYYQCALLMGFMSREFYDKCIDLPKPIRLRLIGSIATKKSRYNYVGGRLVGEPEIIENKVLRNVWHNIVLHVGRCMEDIAKIAGDKFIMYWVDGIYLLGKAEEWEPILAEVSSRWGFEFKTEPIIKAFMDYDSELKSDRLIIHKKVVEKTRVKIKQEPIDLSTPDLSNSDNPENTEKKQDKMVKKWEIKQEVVTKIKPFYIKKL